MENETKCVCYQEIHKVSYLLEEANVECITDHPGFFPKLLQPFRSGSLSRTMDQLAMKNQGMSKHTSEELNISLNQN